MRLEDRAARRSLLVARATLERAQLLQQLDTLSPPDKPLGLAAGLGRLAQGPLQGSAWLRVALSVVQMMRRHPVLVPALATAGTRILRGRFTRWVLLGGVLTAVAAWALRRQSRSAAYADDTPVY
jgi:hypothetical protein